MGGITNQLSLSILTIVIGLRIMLINFLTPDIALENILTKISETHC